MKHLEQKRGAEAAAEWQKAVHLDPHNATAWELLGNYYTAANHWAQARTAWNELVKLDKATAEVYYQLAISNGQLGDPKAARRYAEQTLKEDKDHIGALNLLSRLLTREADLKYRIKHLQHMVKLDPHNEDYISRLAEALVENRQYKTARPLLNTLLKLKPDFGPAYSMRGATIFYTDPSPQGLSLALADLNKGISYNQYDVIALLFLGRVHLRKHQPQKAITYLEKLERMPNAHITYLFELARAHQMAGNTKKAREIRARYAALENQEVEIERAKEHLFKRPKDYDVLLKLGLLLLETRKPLWADSYILQAAALRPNDPRSKAAVLKLERIYTGHLDAASNALKQKDYSKASSHISKAMMLRPYDPRTAKALQQIQQAMGISQSTPAALQSTPSQGKPPREGL